MKNLHTSRPVWKKYLDYRTLIFMCVPAILFFTVFCYIPMPGAYIAFTDFKYNLGIFGSKFAGFDNFKFLLVSGKLWQLTRNTRQTHERKAEGNYPFSPWKATITVP